MKKNVTSKTELYKERKKKYEKIRTLLIKNQLDSVESLIEDFLKEFNCDNYDLLLFLDFYVKKGDPIKATEVYVQIDKDYKIKNSKLISNYFLLLCHSEMYSLAYKVLDRLKENEDFDEEQINSFELFLKKKLGEEINVDKEKLRYLDSQIVDYQIEQAILHIEKHVYVCDESVSRFDKNIKIEDLLDIVLKSLPNAVLGESSNVLDVYVFDCPNIGYNFEGALNYLKVVTLIGSYDIVTMYPCNNEKNDYVNEKFKSLSKKR